MQSKLTTGGCIAQSSPGFDSRHSQDFLLLMLLRFIDGSALKSGHRLDNVS